MRAPLVFLLLTLCGYALHACTPPPAPEKPSETIRIVPLPPAKPAASPQAQPAKAAPAPAPTLPADDTTLRADLEAGLAQLKETPADQAAFKKAYLWTFAEEKSARNYAGAGVLLKELLSRHPRHAQALRAQGYVAINQGFDIQRALELYRLALDADPDHGPSHYAIAFLFGRTNPEEGRKHFERAMALGIPDARGLEERYYSAPKKAP